MGIEDKLHQVALAEHAVEADEALACFPPLFFPPFLESPLVDRFARSKTVGLADEGGEFKGR